MDHVQNCDGYINIPSSQSYRSCLLHIIIHTFIDTVQSRNKQTGVRIGMEQAGVKPELC
jgi:hypothetical protein